MKIVIGKWIRWFTNVFKYSAWKFFSDIANISLVNRRFITAQMKFFNVSYNTYNIATKGFYKYWYTFVDYCNVRRLNKNMANVVG